MYCMWGQLRHFVSYPNYDERKFDITYDVQWTQYT
jgi:hypothetical protein